MPILCIAMSTRVVFVPCLDYSRVHSAVHDVLRELGGLRQWIRAGQTVLLKPNLLLPSTAEEARTTHPELVRALIRAVRDVGAMPVVGDSPADVGRIEEVWERTGFRGMCEEENVPLLRFEKREAPLVQRNGVSFSVARDVLDADFVISVPKVKTHVLTVFTGAVKNMYGALPGYQKTQLHKLYPRPRDFGRLLAAVYAARPPNLAVADAVVGMDGEGPSAGTPRNLGFLAASTDAVALDLALCDVLGIPSRSVPYFEHLRKAGIGPAGMAEIEITGKPSLSGISRFRTPSTLKYRLIPSPLVNVLRPFVWIRPRFGPSCTSCGRCVKGCPAGALTLVPPGPPELSSSRCVACCCCQEVCPEKAVEMIQSPLLRFAKRVGSAL